MVVIVVVVVVIVVVTIIASSNKGFWMLVTLFSKHLEWEQSILLIIIPNVPTFLAS